MKNRSFRDLIIGIFLLSSLSASFILVSCSEDAGILLNSTTQSNIGNPVSQGFTTAALSQFFTTVGEGAEGALGFSINGWILSAMGLAGSSPDYEAQIKLIANDLDSIIVLLNDIGNELAEINQTLLILNCSEQQSSLQTEIGRIEDLLDQYNAMLATANMGDTIPRSVMQDWTDQVLARNQYSGQQSVGELLSTIEINVSAQTGALYSCIVTIPQPSATGVTAFGVDSNYYNNVEALTNFYYYYQAIALSLLSEAYHYDAWAAAGYPNSDTLSSDSVQAVCNANGTSATYCNDVRVKTNELYNSLLTQFSYGGASYSNEHTILQNIQGNPVVWVKSLEDFTSQAGFNCPDPLTNSLSTETGRQPCGPAMGCVNSLLVDTVYRGTSGFNYATGSDLENLFDTDSAVIFSSNGAYLESKGFRNMSGKTVIAQNTFQFQYENSQKNLYATPFFETDQKIFTAGGTKYAGYFNTTSYQTLMKSYVAGYGSCTPSGTHYQNQSMTLNYYYDTVAANHDVKWISGWGTVTLCYSDGDWVSYEQFVFTESDYVRPSGTAIAGPFYQLNQQPPPPGTGICPKNNTRFLMPMVYAFSVHCKPGKIPVNIGNVPSMCGEDFNIYLNTNVPRPPTCNNITINPVCTTLN